MAAAKVFVIPGHGAGDPGACSGGFSEAELVRRLASRMGALGGPEVIVGDASRNWYADNGIGRGHCPAGVPVVELHMDSAGPGARGGHVVIAAGAGGPDAVDRALASFIGAFMPGRSRAIVERGDLANPNRAAAMGVNYRLIECGFISDGADRLKFINDMDGLARGILACFGAGEGETVTDQDIERIARRVWDVEKGRETHDRCYRVTSMVKAMCGIGPKDTSDPMARAADISAWTVGRLQRCTAMLKGLCGIAADDMEGTGVSGSAPVRLSDSDVERIAAAVAERLR